MLKKAASVALLAAIAGLAACSGHGKYVSEGMTKSQERVAGLKSMNEYQQAEQAFLAGDLDKAIRHADRSITINPSVPRSHILRGRIMLEKSDLEDALASLQRAEALDPKNKDAQYYMGIVYERFTQSELALERYQKAAEIDPANPQFAVAAAEMMIDLGRVDEADTFLQSQRASFEHNAGVRQTLGHIAMIKGDMDRAVQLFTEARLLAPDDIVVLEDLIRAQIATGKFADAQYNIERILGEDEYKNRRDFKQLLARCLMNLDKPVEAREMLIKLTNDTSGQKDVESWIELGNVSYILKDQNRLRQASQRVMAISPDRPEGYNLRALWLRRGGDLAGAVECLGKAIDRNSSDVDTFLLRGLCLQEQGMNEEAYESYAAALERDPQNEAAKSAMSALSYAAVQDDDQ